jgi:hypothetical protein
MQLAIAIHLAALLPGLPDEISLASVFPRPPAQRGLEPCIEAAGMDAQAATHHPHRERRAMICNKRVSHFASLAKYAVAFFRMSRSSVILASSRFNRRISAACSSPPEPDACENFLFHAYSECWLSRVSQPTRLGFQRSFAAWLSIKSLAITSARKSPIRTSALRQ